MRQRVTRFLPLILCSFVSALSCRAVLGITPGHEADEGGAGGSLSSGGSDAAGTGDTSSGGTRVGTGGSAGKGGKGGSSNGGATAGGDAGAANAEAGQGGAPAAALFPDPDCSACMARNCATEAEACSDATCTSGVADWLACSSDDPSTCVTADAGPLQDLETCGVQSCDLCRHTADGTPSIEILSPSNGAMIPVDSSGLVEVTVQVHHFTVKGVAQCGTDPNCGHIHINLDGTNCHSGNPFYNQLVIAVGADGSADTAANTAFCVNSVFDRTVNLTASLSSSSSHADRVPAVLSTVKVTLSKQ